MSKQPPTYYTVISAGYGYHYVKFANPPQYTIESVPDDQIYQDPAEASREFLKSHPGAQWLNMRDFRRETAKLENQYKDDQAKLKAWNGA